MQTIESAISSIGRDKFRDEFWDRAVAYIPSSSGHVEEARNLLEKISCFLDRTDIRYPSLRLVKDGREIPLEDYTRELRIGPHTSHDWVVNELVFQYYQQGATIVLQMLQNSLPSFGNNVNRMEEYFGANVHVSCFITPPGAQGFTAHYDTYSFFAVQLFGKKQWSLYNSTEQLPIRDDREYEGSWDPVEPERELTLNVGDVMYVPRGRYHSALTSTEASVHATVGIFSPNWIDATKAAFAKLHAIPQMRQSIASGGEFYSDANLTATPTALLRSELNLEAGVKSLTDQVFSKHVDARVGRLHDLLSPSGGRQPQIFMRQSVPHRLEVRNSHAVLQFSNKEIALPVVVYPILLAISSKHENFEILDLPKILDHRSMQILLGRLVAEGFLRARAYAC